MSLVRTEPDKARSLLIDFSNYYRQTLSDSDTLTTLEHEVEQGTRYINLMQARYGDGRLRVSVDIDFEVRDCMVPPFILQPLLENCIKHAQRETEPLSIHVRAFETDDGLEIIVEDDGIGMSEEVCAHLFEQHRREEPLSLIHILIAFLLGAIFLVPVGAVFGELTAAIPISGGIVEYVDRSFGRTPVSYTHLPPWPSATSRTTTSTST